MESPHFPGTAPIDAYGNGGFRFAGMSHRGSILCLANAIVAWRPRRMDDLKKADFAPVFAPGSAPELLLIGTGADHAVLPSWVRPLFSDNGVRVDAMSTGAAARTYNVLLAEQRSIGAALLAVD
ncbi:MAG: hypothetical protein KDJ77_17560 [Rhodobiaceae bacterium]|nr:hypothetical protein [Rhodobiaceae bacterium]